MFVWYTWCMNKSIRNSAAGNLSAISTYQAGVVQSQAHRKLKKAVASFLLPHGLTMMEWFALGLIKDAGESGLSTTALAAALQTTLPYTTNLINHLVNKGFVLRQTHSKDSRSKILRIDPEVIKMCEAIEIDLRENLRKLIYANISPEELQIYVKVLYKIAQQDN